MKVCLISTLSYAEAVESNDLELFLNEFYLPLGILSITPIFENLGHQTKIIDCNLESFETNLTPGEELYSHIVQKILNENPDVIGFTTMCDSYHHTIVLANKIRKKCNIPIILGGPQSTAVARETLEKFNSIDVIVKGEAESVIEPLMHAMSGKIPFNDVPNLIYQNSKIIKNIQEKCESTKQKLAFIDEKGICETLPAPLITNLDDLPIPAFERYRLLAGKLGSPNLEAGRGCPFECNFCSTNLFFQRRYRIKTGERLLKEISKADEVFGKQPTYKFIHDMLTVDKKRVSKVCNVLSKSNPVPAWTCSARVDCVSRELLQDMAKGGCISVYFGIESGSKEMQQKMKKRLQLDQLMNRIDDARDFGMDVTLSFICGFPDETITDLEGTVSTIFDAVRRYGTSVDIQMHILAPYVGTELYSQNEDNLKFDGYFSDQVGQPVQNLTLKMIKENPKLFSNFYYIPTKNYPREMLFGIDSFIYILLKNYPLTLLAILNEMYSPLQIYRDWQKFALQLCNSTELAFVNIKQEVVAKSFQSLINNYLSKLNNSRLIKDIFLYEDTLLIVSNQNESLDDSRNYKIPTMSKKAKIIQLSTSIDEVKICLKNNNSLAGLTGDNIYNYVMVKQGLKDVKVFLLNSFAMNLVKSCDNETPLSDIVTKTIKKYIKYSEKEVKRVFYQTLTMLEQNEIIKVNAKDYSMLINNT